uniref:Uncharacterized protein n=1 Tax=Oryza brachyantha TaxID=4533 RepID=J3KXR3_ORYBR
MNITLSLGERRNGANVVGAVLCNDGSNDVGANKKVHLYNKFFKGLFIKISFSKKIKMSKLQEILPTRIEYWNFKVLKGSFERKLTSNMNFLIKCV